MAIARHWNSTYKERRAPLYVPPDPPPTKHNMSQGVGNVEGSFVWQDGRGNWHFIAHSQGLRNICGSHQLGGYGCAVYGTFRLNFHHFNHIELGLRGHTHVQGADFSCLRLKLADMVLI